MCKSIMEIKTIKVNKKTWDKLMRYKLNLGAKNVAEVIDRIISIVPAKDLEKSDVK